MKNIRAPGVLSSGAREQSAEHEWVIEVAGAISTDFRSKRRPDRAGVLRCFSGDGGDRQRSRNHVT
jgi:hypothetical protein